MAADDEEINPFTQSLWGKGLMATQYHYWMAGEALAVCGQKWHGPFWSLTRKAPERRLCCDTCLQHVLATDSPYTLSPTSPSPEE